MLSSAPFRRAFRLSTLRRRHVFVDIRGHDVRTTAISAQPRRPKHRTRAPKWNHRLGFLSFLKLRGSSMYLLHHSSRLKALSTVPIKSSYFPSNKIRHRYTIHPLGCHLVGATAQPARARRPVSLAWSCYPVHLVLPLSTVM